jgi:hypothetical protein
VFILDCPVFYFVHIAMLYYKFDKKMLNNHTKEDAVPLSSFLFRDGHLGSGKTKYTYINGKR